MSEKTLFFKLEELDHLLALLQSQGYVTLGPRVREQALVYAEIQSCKDLPKGCRDTQSPGHYRIEKSRQEDLFAYALGANTWKSFFLPAETRLWKAQSIDGKLQIEPEQSVAPHYALLGVKPCELAAIARQDQVLLAGPYPDLNYQQRRQNSLLITMDCHFPAASCFCTSMHTGPVISEAHPAIYDLALSESVSAEGHGFLACPGSDTGKDLLDALQTRGATEAELAQEALATEEAQSNIQVNIDAESARQQLPDSRRSSLWQEIAERCLACSNCTMVCPTCFCTSVIDENNLDGSAQRERVWDSCFSADFSYLHGAGPVRESIASRYRQWLTHKLSSWHEQFGSSGCVGCGRCITWCPVGIDIRQESMRFVAEAQKGARDE